MTNFKLHINVTDFTKNIMDFNPIPNFNSKEIWRLSMDKIDAK